MIVKRGNKICVVHSHPKKAGSETDKPEGAVIHCYEFKKGNAASEDYAYSKAEKMHKAILISESKTK